MSTHSKLGSKTTKSAPCVPSHQIPVFNCEKMNIHNIIEKSKKSDGGVTQGHKEHRHRKEKSLTPPQLCGHLSRIHNFQLNDPDSTPPLPPFGIQKNKQVLGDHAASCRPSSKISWTPSQYAFSSFRIVRDLRTAGADRSTGLLITNSRAQETLETKFACEFQARSE